MVDVLMLGPDVNVKGGVSFIEKVILERLDSRGSIRIKLIPTHVNGSKFEKLTLALLALWRYLLSLVTKQYDYIYLHMSADASFYRKSIFVLIGALFFRKKIILHMHAGDHFTDFFNNSSGIIQKYIHYVFGKAGKVIALTEKTRDVYEAYTAPENIEVIYNCIDAPDSNKYNPDGKYVSFLGYLSESKGVFDLLEVIPEVAEKYPDIIFALAGYGEIEKIKRIIKAKGIEANVWLPGWVGSQQKEEILQNSIINILPSYHEGLPLSLLEAMSYGVPVITTNISGMLEVVRPEKEGILFNPGDKIALRNAILKLLENKQIRCQFSKNAYHTVKEKFNPENFIRKLTVLFKEVS